MHTSNTTTTCTDEQLTYSRGVSLLEARRRGLTLADAEDVAQDVTVRLWIALGKGTQIKSVEAWTRTATRNHITNQHRDASRLKRGGGILESLTGVSEDKFATA